MDRRLDVLWRQRASAFRREAAPYLQYMAQSGFPGFMILLLIAGAIGYGTFLRQVPASFPVVPAGVLLLTPTVAWSPLRTWLQPADVVFLMPREAEMGGYLARSFRNAAVPGVLLALAAAAVYLPLYRTAEGAPASVPVLLAGAALLKLAGMPGAWQERRMVWPAARRGFRLLRWAMTALALLALLSQPSGLALPFIVLLAALYAAAVRLALRHRFPWERLIGEEERTRRSYYRFFGAFIDVPVQAARVSKRPYLAWTAKFVRYRSGNAYVYLYALSLARAELGGILLRLTAVGMLAVLLAADAPLLEGWGTAAVQLLFTVLIGAQLGALRHTHRHAVWRHIYPLPESRRRTSAAAVLRAALTTAAVLLWLPAAALLLPAGYYAPALAGLAAALWYAARRRPARLVRQMEKERGDE